jgi:tetratricopeptide (TPR) repeat protein
MNMKRAIIVAVGLGVLAGWGFYAHWPKGRANPPGETAVESSPTPAPAAVETLQAARTTPEPTVQPVIAPTPTKPIATQAVPSTAHATLDAAFIARAVDALVSPQSSHQQRRDIWKQLREAGKLDQAIADLEQRVANNPNAAEYPSALGQAYLQKCGIIKDIREQGILAMQADKVFDTALSLDPANWEARFTKAVAMSHWPPVLNKSDEVIQHFQTLIEQQEAQAPQPNFADTYSWLGDQYQKAGRTNDAVAVWQRGAGMYPADEKLRSKLTAVP